MDKIKSLINLVVLLALSLGLWWCHNQQQPPIKSETKAESPSPTLDASTQNPTSPGMSKAPVSSPAQTEKKQLSPELEAKYKAVLKDGIPDKLTSMIQLFLEQRLEMAPDKGININPTDTQTATAFDLTWRDQGQDYRMHVEIDKTEASYKTEHHIYPYSIALWVDEKVKIQVTGHMNMNGEDPVYQDLDVIRYESGPWEKNIKKLTLTN